MGLSPLRSVRGLDGITPIDSVAHMVACDDSVVFVWILQIFVHRWPFCNALLSLHRHNQKFSFVSGL